MKRALLVCVALAQASGCDAKKAAPAAEIAPPSASAVPTPTPTTTATVAAAPKPIPDRIGC
ncbi:MAG: peptidylprolyl isomerase, partial [Polyangiaceae bacterium]|nr:peptidylprolyl isomerase [Polyangiaceae bacterium]